MFFSQGHVQYYNYTMLCYLLIIDKSKLDDKIFLSISMQIVWGGGGGSNSLTNVGTDVRLQMA